MKLINNDFNKLLSLFTYVSYDNEETIISDIADYQIIIELDKIAKTNNI